MKKQTKLILIILSIGLVIILSIKIISLSKELDYEISSKNNLNYENSKLKIELENLKEYNIEYLNRIEQLEIRLNRYIKIENQRKKNEIENNKFISYKVLRELDLRQNPNINSTIIEKISENSIVKIRGNLLGNPHILKKYPYEWWKVEYNGKTGWVVFNAERLNFQNNIVGGESLLIIQ